MDISIKGKNLDVGDALRSHVTDNLSTGVAKYFNNPLAGSVTMSREAHQFRADISVHIGRDINIQGGGLAPNAYMAFDDGLDRIVKQLRRYKRRLRDHHKNRAIEQAEAIFAQQYVLADEHEAENPSDGKPAIIAEMETRIDTLAVGEAVMRMDLSDVPAMMFRNRQTGALNMVYRRKDGNVGWIDPQLSDLNSTQ